MYKLKNVTKRTTQTYDFRTYGNNQPDIYAAISEFVWNSLGYSNRVDIRTTNGRLTVLNDGKPANIDEVYQYSQSYSKSEMSYFGTGMIHSTAAINPSNDDFEFATRYADGSIHVIRAPFGENMITGEADVWHYAHWACTAVSIKDELHQLKDVTATDIGRLFGICIAKGANITFNGRAVIPVLPSDNTHRVKSWVEKYTDKRLGSFICEYSQCLLANDENGTSIYPKSETTEGVWLYYNGCFVSHLGVSRIRKSNGNGFLKPHQCMNTHRTIVNIVTEGVTRPMKVPFNNNKTVINWHKAEGQAITDAIDAAVGDIYRARQESFMERIKRKAIDLLFDVTVNRAADTPLHYAREAIVAPGAKVDAVLYVGDGEYSLERVLAGEISIRQVIEFKANIVKCAEYRDAVGYAISAYGSNCDGFGDKASKPTITVIGQTEKDDAQAFRRHAALSGFDCDFYHYDKAYIEKLLEAENA